MLKIALNNEVEKAVILSKLIISPSKIHKHIEYVCNVSAKFEKHPLKTVRQIYTNYMYLPYNAKKIA